MVELNELNDIQQAPGFVKRGRLKAACVFFFFFLLSSNIFKRKKIRRG